MKYVFLLFGLPLILNAGYFTKEQIEALKALAQETEYYPTNEQKQKLAYKIGLKYRQVNNWYANRRQRKNIPIRRFRFSQDQKVILMSYIDKNMYSLINSPPLNEDIERLSRKCGVKYEQVKTWIANFRNRNLEDYIEKKSYKKKRNYVRKRKRPENKRMPIKRKYRRIDEPTKSNDRQKNSPIFLKIVLPTSETPSDDYNDIDNTEGQGLLKDYCVFEHDDLLYPKKYLEIRW